MVGKVDFTSGPFPNVSAQSVVETQWIKSKPGSRYPFEYVITEHENDPKVPVGASSVP